MKTINKVYWNLKLFFWTLFGLISILAITHSMVLNNIINELQQQEQEPTIDIKNFTETLEIINENCGSVFFTKQYGNEDFTIYKQECKVGGFCKPGYVTIESCLGDVSVLNRETEAKDE